MIIENFTPIASTLGGLMIGTSATLMLLFNGKIAGISGISKGLLSNTGHERQWRALFILGLILGGALMIFLTPESTAKVIQAPPLQMALGGLIVGFGTAMGNGCTSGHGVCGLGRRSVRSLSSVITFMAAGFITMFIMTHVLHIARF
jgi:uncharacterized protein